MAIQLRMTFLLTCVLVANASCLSNESSTGLNEAGSGHHYELRKSIEVIVTSEHGDKLSNKANVSFVDGKARGTVIHVEPYATKQTIAGIGSSFTESSAFVLGHLDKTKRQEVMAKIYGADGANFSLARTVIGSSDFSVVGKHSLAPVAGDTALEHFTIKTDSDGFSRATYPGIKDESYDLLPMIHEALGIKAGQSDSELNIVASAWTAPPWMKNIETWYIRGSADNGWQGTGGELKEEYIPVYADYLIRYIDAYQARGVDIWGITPVNEPQGNGGNWESMHFTAESQRDFIKQHLGPKLHASRHADTRVLIYDQNRDHMKHWTDVILGDPGAAQYVHGTAVHWYASTTRVFEQELNDVHSKFPGFDIIHTEGTIDSLGVAAPEGAGVGDPDGFKESGWFDNDAFWWNETATDWGYTAPWAGGGEGHPMYTPVHRYARNIIVSLNNHVSGWIDWNVVLDREGGPNHVGNFCGAPIMVDTVTGQVYYTPVFDVLAQFSRTIRPGDRAVQVDRTLNGLDDDDLHASATINDERLLSVQVLNTTRKVVSYGLQIGAQYAEVDIPANAVQTVRVRLK